MNIIITNLLLLLLLLFQFDGSCQCFNKQINKLSRNLVQLSGVLFWRGPFRKTLALSKIDTTIDDRADDRWYGCIIITKFGVHSAPILPMIRFV